MFNYSVTSNANWTVTCNATWCDVTVYGSGNGLLTAIYEENLSVIPRVASITVTVSGLTPITVTLTQEGAAPILNVQPSNQDVTYESGTTEFMVISNTDWTVTSDAPWCVPTPAGNGTGIMTAYFLRNDTYEERIATLQVSVSGISPFPVTVTQDGAPVSVGEITADMIRIYPNPNKGIFNIVPEEGDKISLSVIVQDMNGRIIHKDTYKGKNEYQLDLSSFPDGTYNIIINTLKNTLVRKLVILK
jgi:hypothetical protein